MRGRSRGRAEFIEFSERQKRVNALELKEPVRKARKSGGETGSSLEGWGECRPERTGGAANGGLMGLGGTQGASPGPVPGTASRHQGTHRSALGPVLTAHPPATHGPVAGGDPAALQRLTDFYELLHTPC